MIRHERGSRVEVTTHVHEQRGYGSKVLKLTQDAVAAALGSGGRVLVFPA